MLVRRDARAREGEPLGRGLAVLGLGELVRR